MICLKAKHSEFNYKKLKKIIFMLVIVFLATSGLILLANFLKANADENPVVMELPERQEVLSINEDNIAYENPRFENIKYYINEGDKLTVSQVSEWSSFVTVKGTYTDGKLQTNLINNEVCSWECNPLDMSCYTHWNETGPDQFRLTAHTSMGDAVGLANCQNPGLCEPGNYDIRGHRGGWGVPGDSRGNCVVSYTGYWVEGDGIGYHHWSVTNSGYKTTENYQTWVGDFKAPAYGSIDMQKESACGWSYENPNYSLDNCIYNVYKTRQDAENLSNPVASLRTDKNGYAKSGSNLYAELTYYVRESPNNGEHGTNYLVNNEIGTVRIQHEATARVIWQNASQKTFNNPVEDPAPVKLVKADAQTGEPGSTEGNVPSFENAYYDYSFYTDYFKDKSEIERHSASYKRHWVMSTDKNGLTCVSEQYRDRKVDGDNFYENQDGVVACPLGSYVVKETKAPDGYLLSDKTYIVQVVADSSVSWGTKTIIYDADTGKELEYIIDPHTGDKSTKAIEQVKKGDYKFVKKEPIEQQTMPYIPWKITSKTTGEWHVVVTDKNGEVNTSTEKINHTENTNYFDCLLTSSGQVPDEGINEKAITDFFDSGKFSGTWFCWDKEKNRYIPPKDSDNNLGALYYDDYYLDELPVKANEHYQLVSRIFNISIPDWIVDGGTITDNPKPTVHITTYAYNQETGEKSLFISENEKLIDVVSYDDLEKGSNYTLVGTLYDKSTLKPLQDKWGNVITSRTDFQADDDTGNASVVFNLDTLGLADKNIVVYEKLFNDKGELIASHEDIGDWSQTVDVLSPKIKTYLFGDDDSKEISQSEQTKLVDYVDYNNLIPGKTYYLKGEIINKNTQLALASSTVMLVPTGRDGRASVGFTLDTTKLTNDTELVAFETLLYEDTVICEHKNLTDVDQTIKVKKPTIATNLHVNTSYSHLIERTYTCNITDTISYVGLSKGSAYKVKGQIIDKKTGKVFIDCSGKAVETEETKTAENKSGSWEINYSFDSSNLTEGTELVCFEYLYINDTEIAVHKDLTDGNQTVTVVVPSMHISTKARGGTTENKLYAVDDETIIDRVDYSNVEKGFMYRLVGTLMDRTTGEALKDKQGNIISVSEDFVTSGTSGQHEMTFKVDTRQLQDKQITVFEKLYDHMGVVRASHEDLTDDYQSISIPKVNISTELLQTNTGSHELQRYADNKITDTISYEGLCPGHKYSVYGILMDQSTGTEYINEVTGLPVTVSFDFTPRVENDKVSISYTLDSTLMLKDKTLVSFVTLSQAGETIIELKDLKDKNESVTVVTPNLTSNAYSEDGKKAFIANHDTVAHDELTWTNLPINKTLTAYSWFVYEDSGLPVTDGLVDKEKAQEATDQLVYALGGMVTVCNCEWANRWEVQFRQLTNKVRLDEIDLIDKDTLAHVMYSKQDFIPESSKGTVTINFPFDSAATGAGKIVAMTVLVSDNTVIANHTDINDKDEEMEILRSSVFTKFADVNGNKEVTPETKVLLVDHVEYYTVIPGKQYKLHGKVINKSNGEVITENEIKFTPDQANGDIDVPFEINTSNLAGLDLVCYETLYLEGTEACIHADINDADQTIHVNGISPGSLFGNPQTGDKWIIFVVIAILLLLLAIVIFWNEWSDRKRIQEGKKIMEEMKEDIDTSILIHDDKTPESITEEEIPWNSKDE